MKRTCLLCGCIALALSAAACSPHELEVGWKAGMTGRGMHYAVGYGRALDEMEGRKGGMPVGYMQVDEKKMLEDPDYWEGRADALAGRPMSSK